MSTRGRSDEDFEREIQAHLELEAARLVEEGLDPAAASAAARRRFGNVTRARERWYEARRVLWIDHLRQDLRAATRQLRRRPAATLVAILSLACGIGATTVTLTVRDLVFRRPPPLYVEPAQLSRVQVGRPDRPIMPMGSAVPAPLYTAWHEAIGLPMAGSLGPRGLRDVRTDDREAGVPVRAVSHDLFAVLGVAPALGRQLAAAQDGPRKRFSAIACGSGSSIAGRT